MYIATVHSKTDKHFHEVINNKLQSCRLFSFFIIIIGAICTHFREMPANGGMITLVFLHEIRFTVEILIIINKHKLGPWLKKRNSTKDWMQHRSSSPEMTSPKILTSFLHLTVFMVRWCQRNEHYQAINPHVTIVINTGRHS